MQNQFQTTPIANPKWFTTRPIFPSSELNFLQLSWLKSYAQTVDRQLHFSFFLKYGLQRNSRTELLSGKTRPQRTSWLRCVECIWNPMAHGDAREGKWRGNWRMEWVASTLTLPRNVVYPVLLTLMRTPRLPVVDWTDAPADLNGLVRFAERRNLVSACVPSHFKRTIET